jgi:hypothetical protein
VPLQLYMTPDKKRWICETHDFYVAQIDKRVIAQFQNMKADADSYAEAEYKRLSARYGHEDVDPASIGESAYDNAVEYYRLLRV